MFADGKESEKYERKRTKTARRKYNGEIHVQICAVGNKWVIIQDHMICISADDSITIYSDYILSQ